MGLYRRGESVNWKSSWYPTIDEALSHPNGAECISIMRLPTESFQQNFEARGIGYGAKSQEDYIKANPIIEIMTTDTFLERLEHPIIGRLYTDGTR